MILNLFTFCLSAPLLLLLLLLVSGIQGQQQEQMKNVKVALFPDNNWMMNVNYLAANSSSFWREYVLKAECETVVKFQEVYCLGKSVNVTVVDNFHPDSIYHMNIQSKQEFSCSRNVGDPDVAAMDPRYSKGTITLPKGVYTIKMKLDDYQNVLGYRGYAVKASVSLKRALIARQCRSRHNPNTSY